MAGPPPPAPGHDLPPIPPGSAAAPPPPLAPRRGWLSRRLLVVLAVMVVLAVGAVVGASLASHRSNFPVVTSSSTDGTFNAGDCVSLSATRVSKADCGTAHDAQIIEVIHAGQSCPSGVEEFDVNDGTGNLCLDRGNHSKG